MYIVSVIVPVFRIVTETNKTQKWHKQDRETNVCLCLLFLGMKNMFISEVIMSKQIMGIGMIIHEYSINLLSSEISFCTGTFCFQNIVILFNFIKKNVFDT